MTSWLITGGSGSFGKAFTKRLLADPSTSRIAILSRDELKQAEMAAEFHDPRLRFFIGSVCDKDRVERAMVGVDYVVHAAAMKRVDTCDANPYEATETNIGGAAVVSLAAIKSGVKKAVILSTDKAVAAHTYYGISKAAAEGLWIRNNVYAAGQVTRLSATRYGNVLNSRGSVLDVWKKQAARGGPLTVREPYQATRFWMTMDQAVDLVLLAFREMQGGEVFLPKIDGSRVGDLAAAAFPNVGWHIAGLGADEKMHEALLSEHEAREAYDYGDHIRIRTQVTWEQQETTMTDTGARPVPREVPYEVPRAVPADFTYRSDTGRQLSVDELREMVA